MHKLFFSPDCICQDKIYIRDDVLKHIRALRLKLEDKMVMCDGNKNDYFCVLKEITDKLAVLKIHTKKSAVTEPPKKIFLFQSMPKGDKFEIIIQKAVELGVNKIIPVISEFCDIKKMPSENKLSRWRKIILSAAEQSGRGIVPEILNPLNFEDAVLFATKLDHVLIAHEKSDLSLREFFINDLKNNLGVFIGPEGGFSDGEIEIASEKGMKIVSLGKRILRTETAGQFVLSIISYNSEL